MLYPNNETHRNALADQSLSNLLCDDIIFYQRDLKPKKSLIADCKFEYAKYQKDGEEIKKPLKCIAKSNPFFQEFRLWHFIKNLRIIQKETENEQGEKLINIDVTDEKLTMARKEHLFGSLNNRKEVSRSALLRLLGLDADQYTWNYEENHIEPCNETRYDFVRRLKRIKNFDYDTFLCAKSKVRAPKHDSGNKELIDGPTNEYLLWHFFYSVKKKEERTTGLPSLVEKLLCNADMDISFRDKVVEMLCTISTYRSEYRSYSEKAIKKLMDDESIKLVYDYKNYKFEIHQDGRNPFDFTQLSDGYSAAIRIMADLMMRMDQNWLMNNTMKKCKINLVIIRASKVSCAITSWTTSYVIVTK